MRKVIIYRKEDCPLCDKALSMLEMMQNEYALEIDERDIEADKNWFRKYQWQIPVIEIDDTILQATEITYETLEKAVSNNMV